MASSTKVLSDLLGMSIVMTSPESVGVGVWEGREAGLLLGGREEESPCGEMRGIFLKNQRCAGKHNSVFRLLPLPSQVKMAPHGVGWLPLPVLFLSVLV